MVHSVQLLSTMNLNLTFQICVNNLEMSTVYSPHSNDLGGSSGFIVYNSERLTTDKTP